MFQLNGITPECGRDVWIAPGAILIGNVKLADQSNVWFNAVIRGDLELITVGDRSNIQDGCVLHTDIGYPTSVGKDCTVGHGAILHGCTLADCVLIGMGATVLNGAKIGTGVVVAAGALVPERKEIPAFSLVMGVPGRVIRCLSEDVIEHHKAAAKRYVDNAKLYCNDISKM